MTSPNNPFVGSQAQRWLARQRTPEYVAGVPSPPVPQGPGAQPTITPNPFVGAQAQRWAARQRQPSYWPVDSPPSYIAPVTPPAPGQGLCIRGNYGFVGITAAAPDGTYWRMPQFTYQTDSQFIAIVLGDEGGSGAQPTILYFHCDTGFTQGAFLSITYNSFTLGSFRRAGSTITYQPFNNGSLSMLLLSGQIVGVQNVGNAYTVVVNGQPMLEFTGGSVAMGASFRSAAVSMSRMTDGNGFIWDSYRLAALSLADYVQPVYTGTGARISRHSTTGTTGTSGAIGNTPLEANLFDTIDISTADIIPNLANGSFTINTPGWYHLAARWQTSDKLQGSGTTSCIAGLVIYKNGQLFQYGMDWHVGYLGGGGAGGNVDINPTSLWGAFDVSLDAGDVVQIGLYVTGAAMFTTGGGPGDCSAVGDATGGKTFFTATLSNPKGSGS